MMFGQTLSRLRCLTCKTQSYVNDGFNMLSMSVPSSKAFQVSGYVVPFLMSETISSFKFDACENTKYNILLEQISKKYNDICFNTTKMYYMTNSKIIGNYIIYR